MTVWNHGEDPETYTVDTGRLGKVIQTAAKLGWGRGSEKAEVSVSLPITASYPTLPLFWMKS